MSDSASMSIAVEKQRVHFRCLFVGVYVYQHRWSLLRIFLFAPPPDRNCGRIHCWERCRFLSSRVVPYIPPILVCLEPSINHLRRLNYFHTIRWFIDETHLRDSPAQKQRGVDLISNVLPFGRLWYGEPNAISNAIGYQNFTAAQ